SPAEGWLVRQSGLASGRREERLRKLTEGARHSNRPDAAVFRLGSLLGISNFGLRIAELRHGSRIYADERG
ncbi:MAG: hypothetical protein ND866_16305, partial [Pyrinomonadaceae bacterium]|nr:hypothetical protein [Pyrinomonadaceae bacterium]